MSNLKKVISLLLCLSMLAGMVAILDGAFVPTASAASAEPVTHKIKTMEQLNAEYGNKGFYYLGLEFYESNGKPTDGYVQPGDTLEVRVYVKSSFFMSKLSTHYVFENTFFDVKKNGAYEKVSKAAVNPDYTVTPDSKGSVGLHVTQWLTEAAASNNSYTEAKIGIPDATMKNWDLCEINNLTRNDGGTRRNFKLDQDNYIYSFNVTVKEGLAEGTVGSSILTDKLFKSYERFNGGSNSSNRKGDAYLAPDEATTAKNMFAFADLAADCLDIADCNYTFVIGENPMIPDDEGKFTVKFNDGDELTSARYAAGEKVAVPEAKNETDENKFIGWANTVTGGIEDLKDFVMPEKSVSYQAVYAKDTFDVTFDYLGGEVDGKSAETFKFAYGETVDLSKITVPTRTDYVFKGWNPADVVVNNINGITVKATWAPYTINFMVMDYKTGEWKVLESRTGTATTTALTYNGIDNIAKKITGEKIGWDGDFVYSNVFSYDADNTQKIRNGDTVAYEGEKNIYIHTQIKYNVTLTVPTYNPAEDAYTGDPKVIRGTVTAVADTGVAGYAPSELAPLVIPVDGFIFKQWVDTATGEKAAGARFNNNSFDLIPAYGKDINYTAVLGPREYELRFNMGSNYALASVKACKGDTIYLDQLTYTASGNEVFLPEVNVEASQQKTPSWKDNGNLFRGWSWNSDIYRVTTKEGLDAETFITFPLTITQELIDKYAKIPGSVQDPPYFTFYDAWEALEYPVRFFVITKESDPEYLEEPFMTLSLPAGTNMLQYTSMSPEVLAKLNELAPDGKEFLAWAGKDTNNVPAYLPMGGFDYYIKYKDEQFTVYADFNNGKDTALVSWNISATYGADPERAPDPEKVNDKGGPGYSIRKETITDFQKPADNYEIIGWKVYHLDNPEDISDPTKWKEGYNDEGTQVAKATLVYQAQWISHRELFFRVFSSNGKLYCALSKKFKMYYWNDDTCCNKGEGKLNHHGDTFFIAFYKIELENWDWNGFFKPEMWQNVSLRFTAYPVPKDIFSIEGIKGLIEIIKNLINGGGTGGDTGAGGQ